MGEDKWEDWEDYWDDTVVLESHFRSKKPLGLKKISFVIPVLRGVHLLVWPHIWQRSLPLPNGPTKVDNPSYHMGPADSAHISTNHPLVMAGLNRCAPANDGHPYSKLVTLCAHAFVLPLSSSGGCHGWYYKAHTLCPLVLFVSPKVCTLCCW